MHCICGCIVYVDAIHAIVGGDFNCQQGSRLFSVLVDCANDNKFVLADIADSNLMQLKHSTVLTIASYSASYLNVIFHLYICVCF